MRVIATKDKLAASLSAVPFMGGAVALSAVSVAMRHPLVRFVLVRTEVIEAVLLAVLMFYYVQRMTRSCLPLIRGRNLRHCDMKHSEHFEPPKFLDLGFSDIKKYDEFWHYKHKNFSFSASQGFRDYMEDRMHFMHDPNNNLSIFGIFDGHGGQFVSDYLEMNFAFRIRERLMRFHTKRKLSMDSNLSDTDPVSEAIVTEVHNIDDAISRLDPAETSLTGSTLIAAVVEAQRWLTIINVGDSRAVGCDARGRCVSLSEDHKPNDRAEKRRIEGAGGFVSLDDVPRVQGILAVSRSFGDTLLKRAGVLTAHPDVRRIDLGEEPLKFIIAATDGFWDVIDNHEAVSFAQEYLKTHPRQWHRVSTYLVRIALARNTHDNVSVLFIRF